MDHVNRGFSSWLGSPAHEAWLGQEGDRLLGFAKAAKLPQGFGNLDDHGRLPADAIAETMNTARMTHSFAMAHINGIPGCAALVDHGIAALAGPLRDAEHGGWFAKPLEHSQGDTGKAAYLHAFVALAASSAVVAQRPGAQALLEQAIQVITQRFWSEEEGAMRESFVRDWSEEEAYRGANSNMHSVEAFLALADVTGNAQWLDRALRIVERVIHQHAAGNDHQVIEHFDLQWNPDLQYNHDKPDDGFRPYGTTPGHAFEWARLVLHLEAADADLAAGGRAWAVRKCLSVWLGRRWRARHRLHPGLGKPARCAASSALDPRRSGRCRRRLAATHGRGAIRNLVSDVLGIQRDAVHRSRTRQLAP
jgi:mannose/cellobiose epimerase-like protein (N-acyl-D-glucosamine 2-epimerase family)